MNKGILVILYIIWRFPYYIILFFFRTLFTKSGSRSLNTLSVVSWRVLKTEALRIIWWWDYKRGEIFFFFTTTSYSFYRKQMLQFAVRINTQSQRIPRNSIDRIHIQLIAFMVVIVSINLYVIIRTWCVCIGKQFSNNQIPKNKIPLHLIVSRLIYSSVILVILYLSWDYKFED